METLIAGGRSCVLNGPMADYLERVYRFFTVMALSPLLVGIIGSWSRIGELLLLLGIPIALIALPAGTIFWLYRGAKLPILAGRRQARGVALGLAPMLLAITVLAAPPLFSAGIFVGGLTRLMVDNGRYEAIVAKAAGASGSVRFARYDGITYSTDMGPPVRVAFNPLALRSSFGAIVHDPSGDVMLAKGWDDSLRDFRGPDRVTGLFLGGMIGCQPLRGHYYTCWSDW